jgi:hypothetical protein
MDDFLRILSSVADRLGSTDEGKLAMIRATWRRAAGEMLSQRARPVKLDGTKLEVAVADRMWQRQLAQHTTELLFKLNSTLKDHRVSEIRYVIEPSLFAKKEVDAETTKPARDTAHLSSELAAAAESIGDLSLRRQFLAAATASSQGKKVN